MNFRRAFLLFVAISAYEVPAVYATNFSGATGSTGCSGTVNMQDNSTMTFSRQSLTANNFAAVADTINTDVIPTDVSVAAEMSTPDSNTDVIYYDYDYWNFCGFNWHTLGSTIGLTVCVSLSGSRCNQFEVHLDTSFTESRTSLERQALSCHETGHTLGLKHQGITSQSYYGCMPNPFVAIDYFSDHDVGHINANY